MSIRVSSATERSGGVWRVPRPRFRQGVSFLLVLVSLLTVLAGAWVWAEEPNSMAAGAISLSDQEATLASQINSVFRRAVERVRPAVVFLKVARPIESGAGPVQSEHIASGSGCIIDKRGYILTSNHLVAEAARGKNDGENGLEITIILADGRRFYGQEVFLDPDTDLAVVKIEAGGAGLPVAVLGDSDEAQVGDFVMAIGNPFGLYQTVTGGIISYKGRQSPGRILGDWGYEDFIQTDADINRGNSGGPLVNLHGQIIAINSNIFTPNGYWAGYGFAVPSNMAKFVVEQLIANHRVRRGWLGMYMIGLEEARKMSHQELRDIEEPTFQEFLRIQPQFPHGLPSDLQGAYVFKVVPGGPAARAGIRPKDVILSIDDVSVTVSAADRPDGLGSSSRQVRNLVATLAPGSVVQCRIWRQGKSDGVSSESGEQVLEVTVGDRDVARARAGGGAPSGMPQRPLHNPQVGKLGMEVQQLTTEIAQRFGYPRTLHGVIIVKVHANSPAAQSGLEVGDIVLEVNGVSVRTTVRLKTMVDRASVGGVEIEIRVRSLRGEDVHRLRLESN